METESEAEVTPPESYWEEPGYDPGLPPESSSYETPSEAEEMMSAEGGATSEAASELYDGQY